MKWEFERVSSFRASRAIFFAGVIPTEEHGTGILVILL
jgi:hypothetical protein